MKLIAIGDNVVDCYLNQKKFYPGGNAVNVAVGCKRCGAEKSEYIGVFGTDPEAAHLQWALDQEGVYYDKSRTAMGKTGHPGVTLTDDGDRVFVAGPKDTVQHTLKIRLLPEELDYLKTFDAVHTSCYSHLEEELPLIVKNCPVSFDFSTRNEDSYLALVCPHIKFGFFSGSDLGDADIERIITTAHRHGTEIVGITLGAKGALFSQHGRRYRQNIIPVDVTDTMGAGDSFIAGFLTSFFCGETMEKALLAAAQSAAKACTYFGGFGYGRDFFEK